MVLLQDPDFTHVYNYQQKSLFKIKHLSFYELHRLKKSCKVNNIAWVKYKCVIFHLDFFWISMIHYTKHGGFNETLSSCSLGNLYSYIYIYIYIYIYKFYSWFLRIMKCLTTWSCSFYSDRWNFCPKYSRVWLDAQPLTSTTSNIMGRYWKHFSLPFKTFGNWNYITYLVNCILAFANYDPPVH